MSKKTFKQHPNLKEYHETSDGVKFFQLHDARTHARSLEDKAIETVKKPSMKVVKDSDKPSGDKNIQKDGVSNAGKDITPMQAAKNRAIAISKLPDVESVELALKDETAKSVKKAGEARIKEINEASGEATDNPENKE